MALIGPDDPARNLPWLYLGPKGYRFPTAPVSAYFTYSGIVGGVSTVAFIAAVPAKVWLAVTVATAVAAGVLVRRLFQRVDMTYSVAYWRDTLRAEAAAPRPPTGLDFNGPGDERRLSPAMFHSRRDPRP